MTSQKNAPKTARPISPALSSHNAEEKAVTT